MSFICHNHGWKHGQNPCPICHPELRPKVEIQELKAEDIVKPLSILDEMTTEEMLFWATPYYDQLQEEKRLHQEALDNGVTNG